MLIGPPIPEIQHFQNLTMKILGQVQMTMVLHSYRSRQSHRISNGINPSSGFRDMGSAKSGPSAAWFDKFVANEQAHMGQMGKWLWRGTTAGLARLVHETWNWLGRNTGCDFLKMEGSSPHPQKGMWGPHTLKLCRKIGRTRQTLPKNWSASKIMFVCIMVVVYLFWLTNRT